jgi:hypothetical protein
VIMTKKSKDPDPDRRPSPMLIVSPSPRELYDALSTEERVAIDHLVAGTEDPVQLDLLVPDARRLAFLRGLVPQLLAFGFSIGESAQLGLDRERWEAQRAQARKRAEEYQNARDEARDRDRAWLESLPAETRQAVERTRRRRARRRGRT